MRYVLDLLFVGLVISVSLAYVVFALGPKALRVRAADAIAARAARVPSAFKLRRGVFWLSESLGAKAGGACGGCNSCGTTTKDPAAASKDPAAASAGTSAAAGRDVRVPVARIGRRGVTPP